MSYETVVREELAPVLIVAEHFLLCDQFCVTEARVGVVREADVRVELYHLLDCVYIALRESIPETVHIGDFQCLDEDVDGCEVIMRA